MEGSIEKVADAVLQRMDQMAEWLNGTGADVLAVYTEKAYLSAFSHYFWALPVLGLAALCAWGCRYNFIQGRKNNSEDQGAWAIALGVITCIFVALFGAIVFDGFIRMMIPEYFAIQELIRQVLK